MSADDDLERILREGWRHLPEPDGAATRRARARVAGVVPRRRRRRVRIAALAATALVVAVGAGVSIGSLIAQDVTAAEGPVGLGFVPEPGWFALQAPSRSPSDRPAVAMAANVPFAEDDVVNGLAEPSSLPYSTLLALPPRGIVIVATFIAADGQLLGPARYPKRMLPLRIWQATPYIEYGTQIRPDQPLGQYQLRAATDGWNVEVNAYFGTPRPSARLLDAAQRQLDGLLTRPAPAAKRARPTPTERAEPASPSSVDRTFVCTPGFLGGRYSVEARVHRGTGRGGSGWQRPPFAAIGTSARGAAATAVENNVAWISSGRPGAEASAAPGFGSYVFPFRTWGTVAVNLGLCRGSATKAPIAPGELVAREVTAFEAPLDCATPRRVLVRIRGTLRGSSTLRSYRTFLRTTAPARTAEIAVSTTSGTPLAYAQVFESGSARLFAAKGCVDD
jgi:hypothetical protein